MDEFAKTHDSDETLAKADALHASGDLGGAAALYLEVLNQDELSAPAWWGLGSAFTGRNQHAAAVECFSRLVSLAPRSVEARHNLGRGLFELGEIDEALVAFHSALAVEPNASSLEMIAVIIPGSSRAPLSEILDARRAWAATLPVADRPMLAEGTSNWPRRIGYVSSFFARRNWMKPVWGLINAHDRDRFDIVLFSDAPLEAIGPEYRRDVRDLWTDISGKSNEDVARLIKDQRIDVLVDLNAFSKSPRLPLFALRPAPLQVQWFNLFATSGMSCFDAVIGDAVVIRPGDAAFFSERLVCGSGSYLTFEVGYPVPDVAPPPCSTGRPFTFGCLAPQYKITPEVLKAWALILSGTPASRLVLKSTFLKVEGNQEWLRDKLSAAGIDPSRVTLEGPSEHFEFLKKYAEIDAALDTFPYNGGTTTIEALWQGVPVLTFHGDRWVGRISASLLRNAGLGEFVADDLEGHIRQAITIANDPETPEILRELRANFRERLRNSPVCDVRGFARSMEATYEDLWADRPG